MKSAHRQADHNPMNQIQMEHTNSITHHHMDMVMATSAMATPRWLQISVSFCASMIHRLILALSPLVQDLLGFAMFCLQGIILRPLWSFCGGLFLLRLAFPQRYLLRTCGLPARHDDAHCGRHFNRFFLFERSGLWFSRYGVLLGADHASRRHAPWTLASDEIHHESLARLRATGSTSPGYRPSVQIQ